jgi:hypothetical protein
VDRKPKKKSSRRHRPTVEEVESTADEWSDAATLIDENFDEGRDGADAVAEGQLGMISPPPFDIDPNLDHRSWMAALNAELDAGWEEASERQKLLEAPNPGGESDSNGSTALVLIAPDEQEALDVFELTQSERRRQRAAKRRREWEQRWGGAEAQSTAESSAEGSEEQREPHQALKTSQQSKARARPGPRERTETAAETILRLRVNIDACTNHHPRLIPMKAPSTPL